LRHEVFAHGFDRRLEYAATPTGQDATALPDDATI
jgi:hypothetical protein